MKPYMLLLQLIKICKEHYELYLLVMNIQKEIIRCLSLLRRMMEPIMEVLIAGITKEIKMHYQRSLRSMMHGFVAHEEYGALHISYRPQ